MERYSEYKDSGVKWLGEIPSHWEVVPIKHSYKFTVGWTPPTGRNDLFEGNNLWANISDLGDKVIRTTTNHISDSAVRQSGRSISPKGSLLYSFKLSVGTVSFCGADMYTNEAIATFLKGKNSLEFLYYAAPIFIIKNANTNIYGAPILNQDLIKNALVLLPPLSEQDAIVRYLDSATSEIDKAIAMQQKMIDLLNERKQIIIQNAVTKGLDENVEMKESGVEWIGRIPKHWEVVRLLHLTSKIGSGSTPKAGYVESGIIFLRSQNVYCEGLKLNDVVHISANVHRNMSGTKVLPNDVLMNITGGSIGRCFYVDETLGEANVNQHVSIIRPTSIDTHYLKYYLQSYCGQIQVSLEQTGGNREGLTAKALAKFLITYPSQSEQKEIAAYLDSKMQRFDTAITNCQRQITLLQERKQIIINEVVTGKVRVI